MNGFNLDSLKEESGITLIIQYKDNIGQEKYSSVLLFKIKQELYIRVSSRHPIGVMMKYCNKVSVIKTIFKNLSGFTDIPNFIFEDCEIYGEYCDGTKFKFFIATIKERIFTSKEIDMLVSEIN